MDVSCIVGKAGQGHAFAALTDRHVGTAVERRAEEHEQVPNPRRWPGHAGRVFLLLACNDVRRNQRADA